MESAAGKKVRKHRREELSEPSRIELWIAQKGGGWVRLGALLENVSELGAGIVITERLMPGQPVMIDGANRGKAKRGRARGKVAWCGAIENGSYRAGVAISEWGPSASQGQPTTACGAPAGKDLYAILELHPSAAPETIHHVYPVLAQRLHPDNPTTGNEAEFAELVRAFRILSNVEQRAAYDARRATKTPDKGQNPEQAEEAYSVAQEKLKRKAILHLLYTKRLRNPADAALGLVEIEELMGMPREHLEFAMWYLRERSWIARADNARFSITVLGVEQAEAEAGMPRDVQRSQPLVEIAG